MSKSSAACFNALTPCQAIALPLGSVGASALLVHPSRQRVTLMLAVTMSTTPLLDNKRGCLTSPSAVQPDSTKKSRICGIMPRTAALQVALATIYLSSSVKNVANKCSRKDRRLSSSLNLDRSLKENTNECSLVAQVMDKNSATKSQNRSSPMTQATHESIR